jgi:hypothetical protein
MMRPELMMMMNEPCAGDEHDEHRVASREPLLPCYQFVAHMAGDRDQIIGICPAFFTSKSEAVYFDYPNIYCRDLLEGEEAVPVGDKTYEAAILFMKEMLSNDEGSPQYIERGKLPNPMMKIRYLNKRCDVWF